MKIGFDAKRAAQNRTGLGNYSRFVIDVLGRYAPHNDYQLYVPSPKKTQLLPEATEQQELIFPTSVSGKKLPSLWRIWGITKDIEEHGTQLFHGLSNELPLTIKRAGGVKSIVTIHDLIFLRYPEYYKFIDRKIYTYKFCRAAKVSDRVIAVSECTKRDLVHYFNISPDKIDVVYQGCDKQFRVKATEEKKTEVKKRYGLPDEYVLYLGTIESRKNLMLVARALKEMANPPQVIAVGKHTPYADEVQAFLKENGLENNLRMIHGVPFDELPSLYQMAHLFVYPSFFEGFGIPLLEALCSGTPAIGATGSCLEEAGGPSSLYVDPKDEKALAAAMEQILSDETLRQKMIADGYTYAARFEDEPLANDLLKVYEKVMK